MLMVSRSAFAVVRRAVRQLPDLRRVRQPGPRPHIIDDCLGLVEGDGAGVLGMNVLGFPAVDGRALVIPSPAHLSAPTARVALTPALRLTRPPAAAPLAYPSRPAPQR